MRAYLAVRKFLLTWVALFILLFAILYLIANSPFFIKLLISKSAVTYKLGYERLEGDLLRGVRLIAPEYNGTTLASELRFRWNPSMLASKTLYISNVEAKDINLTQLRRFLRTVVKKNETRQNDQMLALPATLYIRRARVTLLPFEYEGVRVKRITLGLKGARVSQKRVAASDLSLHIGSDLGTLDLSGDLTDKDLHLRQVSVRYLDIEGVQRLLRRISHSKDQNVSTGSKESTAPLPAEKITIDRATLSTKAFKEADIAFSSLTADLRDIVIDTLHKNIRSKKSKIRAKSEIGTLRLDGKITNNRYDAALHFVPKAAIYRKYRLPFRKEAIKAIDGKATIDTRDLTLRLHTQAKALFDLKSPQYNIDVPRFTTTLRYRFGASGLRIDSNATVDSRFAKGVTLVHSTFVGSKGVQYEGSAKIARFEGLDANLTRLTEKTTVRYVGDAKGVAFDAQNAHLLLHFKSDDYSHAVVTLQNKQPFVPSRFFTLPESLRKVTLHKVDAKSSFLLSHPLPLVVDIAAQSNLLNTRGKLHIVDAKRIAWQGELEMPPHSILRDLHPAVRWGKLFPALLRYEAQSGAVTLRSKRGLYEASIKGVGGDMEGVLRIKKTRLHLSSTSEGAWHAETEVKRFGDLLESIGVFYPLEAKIPIEGALALTLDFAPRKGFLLNASSDMLRYRLDKKHAERIEDIEVSATLKDTKIDINHYTFTYRGKRLFATRPSSLHLAREKLIIDDLLLNDAVHFSGYYDLGDGSADIRAKSTNFTIKEKGLSVDIASNLYLHSVPKKSISVKGDITILGGRVSGDLPHGTTTSDSDIIVLQRQHKKERNGWYDRLALQLFVKTKKAIDFRAQGAKLRLRPELSILKSPKSEIETVGTVEIAKDGIYRLKDKRFRLKKSYVYFAGDVKKPHLDIKATWQAIDYTVNVTVTGTPEAPQLSFSASPYLKREQVLSLLLFGTTGEGDTHSGKEMMRMLGGAVAKAALADAGIKVDHLVFGENGSVEVGKKLGKRTTVIYINDIVPKVKLLYRHSRHTQSVVTVSEESRSYDIVYKTDVKHPSDILFVGKKRPRHRKKD